MWQTFEDVSKYAPQMKVLSKHKQLYQEIIKSFSSRILHFQCHIRAQLIDRSKWHDTSLPLQLEERSWICREHETSIHSFMMMMLIYQWLPTKTSLVITCIKQLKILASESDFSLGKDKLMGLWDKKVFFHFSETNFIL